MMNGWKVPRHHPSVVELEKQYLLQNYARYPLVLHRGKGCYVTTRPASAIWI